MKIVRRFMYVPLLALFFLPVTGLIHCGGHGPKTAIVAKEMPAGESWDGVYYHPVFGRLHMQEQGSNIVGRWQRTDKSKWGELTGTVEGNVVRYTWKEHTYGVVGPHASSEGKGYFVYQVPESKIPELKGKYGVGSDEPGSDWNCVKQMNEKPNLDSIKGELGGAEIPAAQDKWQ